MAPGNAQLIGREQGLVAAHEPLAARGRATIREAFGREATDAELIASLAAFGSISLKGMSPGYLRLGHMPATRPPKPAPKEVR